jgi:hypothetical protein
VCQVKEILIENKSERECAFVALVDQSKMLLDGKHYSKNEMLDEAEKRGFSLLMQKPLAVEELGRLVIEFVQN